MRDVIPRTRCILCRTALGAAALAVLLAAGQSCVTDPYQVGSVDSLVSRYVLVRDLVDERYAGFALRPGVDWQAAYEEYLPMVEGTGDWSDMLEAALLMMGELSDSQLAITDAEGGWNTSHDPGRFVNFDLEVWFAYMEDWGIADSLLRAFDADTLPQTPRLGYAYISDMGDGYSWQSFFSATSRLQECSGVILDLRACGRGGAPLSAYYTVGRFVAENEIGYYVSYREGPDTHDLTEPEQVYAFRNGSWQVTSPTLVLTGRRTAGAAEQLVLLLDTQEHVTIMGDTTAGYGSPVTSLGLTGDWYLNVPEELTFDLSGEAVLGRGIPPDTVVPVSQSDFDAGVDPVLDAALERLSR